MLCRRSSRLFNFTNYRLRITSNYFPKKRGEDQLERLDSYTSFIVEALTQLSRTFKRPESVKNKMMPITQVNSFSRFIITYL